ncbi:MAG: hypothetical protein MN733_29800, partial [Nitrososphaera sp.]|nr:hypothetical protein [Nitrososphaera sp.]
MPLASSKWITHRFSGGWATDYGPTAYTSVGGDGSIDIPFLQDAQNTMFEFDGGLRKCGGASVLNSLPTWRKGPSDQQIPLGIDLKRCWHRRNCDRLEL